MKIFSRRLVKCRYCGKQIVWIQTKAGKNMPCDPEVICYKVPEDGKGKERIVTQNGEVAFCNMWEEGKNKEIDWDGLCEDKEVHDGDYLLVEIGEDATNEQKQATWNYELYMNRYNKKWLDEHGIENSLCN